MPADGEIRSATQTQKTSGFAEAPLRFPWIREFDAALDKWEERRFGRRVSTQWTGGWIYGQTRKTQP
jgi:hypothetical protein